MKSKPRIQIRVWTLAAVGAASLVGVLSGVGMLHAFSTTCGTFIDGIGGYVVNPNFRDSIAGTPQQQIDAVVSGADEWEISGGARLDWVYGGQTTVAEAERDTDNVVFSTNSNGGSILAEAFCYIIAGQRAFDIRFYDGNHSWNYDSSGGRPGFDIGGIACHEFGHALGLGHSTISGSTMWPSSLGDGVANRSIEADDIAGVQSLYGPNIPFQITSVTPSSGTVSGGTDITLVGEGFVPGRMTVLVDGREALISSHAGSTLLTARTPAGVSLGPVDITLNNRFQGDVVFANRFTYTEPSVRLTWTGDPRPGRPVVLQVQGPPGSRYAIASAEGEGTFSWREFEFCLGSNIQPFMKSIGNNPTDPPLDATGFAERTFIVPEDAQLFENFRFHGVVRVGGEFVQTNKATVQVLSQ